MGRYAIVGALTLVLGTGAGNAHAQSTDATLQYDAPASCPGRAYFEQRMRQRMRTDGTRARAGARLQVRVHLGSNGAHGSVSFAQAGRSAERSLDADSCKELVDGLALIAALALAEPASSSAARVRVRPQPPADAPEGPATAASDAADGSDAAGSVALEAALLMLHGIAPRLQPGVQLGASLGLNEGALGWRLRVAGRLALERPLHSAQGDVNFGFVAALVELCARTALVGRTLRWNGCALLEPGLFTAGARATHNARAYRRTWFALGAGSGLGLRLSDWLALDAGAEFVLPVRRDRALLAGELVHQVPLACLRLMLGLSLEL